MSEYSSMLELGTTAPGFSLPDVSTGQTVTLHDIKGAEGTLIAFLCNHCPYVKHINRKFVDIARDFQAKGITFVAISSNDVETYPEDSPEKMQEVALTEGYPFPYLYDETQDIARQYTAACTPDFFIFDSELKLVYRGRMDRSTPGNPADHDGKDLINALDAVSAGERPSDVQFPSIGCGIKWKKPD